MLADPTIGDRIVGKADGGPATAGLRRGHESIREIPAKDLMAYGYRTRRIHKHQADMVNP